MNPVFEQLAASRLVPVIVLHQAGDAAPLAEALAAGGLRRAEVTFRTAAAAGCIKVMAKRADFLVGAGTVLKVDQVKQAMDNGAKFIVSPGFSPTIVSYCVEHGIPITPGVSTPTDITRALEFGLQVLKFFPAETLGGVEALKAISAPFGEALRFIPTGGVTETTLASYLAFPKVIACGGSWMVPDDLIKAGKFDEVAALVRRAVALAGRLP